MRFEANQGFALLLLSTPVMETLGLVIHLSLAERFVRFFAAGLRVAHEDGGRATRPFLHKAGKGGHEWPSDQFATKSLQDRCILERFGLGDPLL